MSRAVTVKAYFTLTKPGIIGGNVLTAIGGYALAAQGHFPLGLLLPMLVGLACIIAAACVCNNYIDRVVDGKMERTKQRPLVQGTLSGRQAGVFACVLGVGGTLLLTMAVNPLCACVAVAGFAIYVLWYSPLKHRTVHATLIGSLAGGVPPVVGYCALSHQCDLGALLLFLIVALWQMPHFFAIALYRFEDYLAAALPVLPVKRGAHKTKIQILLYILAFLLASSLLTLFGYAGYIYLGVMTLLGALWLTLGIRGFKKQNTSVWARTLFRFSLIVIVGFCTLLCANC